MNIKGGNPYVFWVFSQTMDTAICWGTSRCRPRSDILRFRSNRIQSTTIKPNWYDSVTAAFTYSLFGEKSLGQACQESLLWTKLLQQNCSLFLSFSFLLFPTCTGSGHVCGLNLFSLQFADTPSNLCAQGTSTFMIHTGVAQDADLSLLLDASFPSWERHCLLFRKGVDSVGSSSEQLCSQASARKQMCDMPYP